MITELTKEQKELMSVYRDKWIKIGLNTDRFTQEEAQEFSDYLYENILKKPKVPVIVADGPLSAWIIVNLFAFAEKGYKFPIKEISASVRSSVKASVKASVLDSVGYSVEDSVRASVGASVRASARDKKLLSYVEPYLSGSFNTYIFSFYDYIETVLGVDYGEVKANWEWWKSSSRFGQIFPLKEACIISQKPLEIHLKDGKLHADSKPAVKYADGFSIWALNGVHVPQYLAETPASSLDIEFYERDGVLYAKVNEPTTVECVLKERHDDCVLPVGYWEFKKALEFDPLEQELRSVAD